MQESIKKPSVFHRLKHIHPTLWVVSVLFFVYALFLLFPFLFALNSALKTSDGEFLESMNKITLPFDFKNFAEAFTQIEVSGVTFWNMLTCIFDRCRTRAARFAFRLKAVIPDWASAT